jgi:mRNA-degrading endonuclease toxin of MazEF toxin-antitoxin module
VGEREGLKHPSAVNLDHVQTVEKARLVGFIRHAGEAKMRDVCRALAVAVGCDG